MLLGPPGPPEGGLLLSCRENTYSAQNLEGAEEPMIRLNSLVVTLSLPLLTGCFSAGPAPDLTRIAAGNSAVSLAEGATPEPQEVLISPKGRQITPGMVDDLGWVLPLDIKRPRPERPRVPVQSAAELLHRRGELGPPLFPEHRIGPDDGHTQNETSIDIAGNTLVTGWNNFTDDSLVMGVGRSTDGGDSWSFELFGGHTVMSDPVVKAGGGNWYYGYLATGGSGGSDAEIYVRKSTDDGATWQPEVAVTVNTGFDDKPYMDVRGNEVLVAWADFSFSPAKVTVARSVDGGLNFGEHTVLANNSVAGNAASPVIAPDGTYYVFWRDSFQEFFWMSKSTDQGENWSMDSSIVSMSPLPTTLSGGFRSLNAPIAAAHPASGNLLVLWNDQFFGNPDILAIRSTDGGDTWSAPVQVNDDLTSNDQFFPWVVFDEAGLAHAIWYDRRHNGTDIDVYYATSSDGGATWSENLRITAQSFTPVLPGDGGANFIGDYNAIAAAAGKAYPFYQDAREGNQDVYVAIVGSAESIFANGFETGDSGAWSATVPPP